jgi:protein gp37
MAATSIEWCDHSINPLRAREKTTGRVGHFCVKLSPGCAHCYSSRLQSRFGLHEFVATNRDKVDLFLHEPALLEVIARRKPTRYFWCDMTDLFGDWVPDEWIDRCLAAMALTPQHTHMLLTKRPDRMRDYMSIPCRRERVQAAGERMRPSRLPRHWYHVADWSMRLNPWPLPNVWLGVSCENQQTADERIPLLLQMPAAVRFISAEPLLGPIRLVQQEPPRLADGRVCWPPMQPQPSTYWLAHKDWPDDCEYWQAKTNGLSWVIAGGESGPGARPMHPDWARSLRDQCTSGGVSFFFKQWGEWTPVYDRDRDDPDWQRCPEAKDNSERYVNLAGGHGFHGDRVVFCRRVGKKAAGRQLDGAIWDQFPAAREAVPA